MAPRSHYARFYGPWLRSQRIRRGWPISTVHELTSIAEASISKYERGKESPNPDNDQLLRKLFGDPPAYLFEPELCLRQPFFFLMPGVNEDWQRELNFNMLSGLHETRDFCDPRRVEEDYNWQQYRALWHDVLQHRKDYAGGIAVVSPWNSEQLNELKELARKFERPVLFLDHSGSQTTLPDNVASLSFIDSIGGNLAAAAVAQVAQNKNVRRILVVAGPDGIKPDRVEYFKRRLAEIVISECEVVISNRGGFNSVHGAEVSDYHLRAALITNTPFDVVFYISDSMTSGGVEAIVRLEIEKGIAPQIISYDGVASTLELVKKGRIANVVVQDSRDLARKAIEQLRRLCAGVAGQRFDSIGPRLFV